MGGVERGSKRVFLVPVDRRDKPTMINNISNNVLSGTIIITDQWRAYEAALRELPHYTHLTINHSLNFVNPDNYNTHTQSIEGFWSHAKKALRGRNGQIKTSM